MRCPRCHFAEFRMAAPCPECGFAGNGRSLEQLSNLTFLLAELETWSLPATYRDPLHSRYARQQRRVEVELGLREPPPDAAAAALLRLELSKRRQLRQILPHWNWLGLTSEEMLHHLLQQIDLECKPFQERLLDAPEPPDEVSAQKRLALRWEEHRYLLDVLAGLEAEHTLPDRALNTARSSLAASLADLEIKLGMREAPAAEPVAAETGAPEPVTAETGTAPDEPQPFRPKMPRLTWDRVWETLLSERTLHAILFLGVILLFGSGVSWITWNWDTFPPLIQITFLGGFTVLFYGLGGYVGQKMQLRGSSIALYAVASLLVPLDFVAFYLSGGFPPGTWPEVWLAASVVCLLAYLGTTLLIRAEFFGYLVALALGSLVVAGFNLGNVPAVWWQSGITAVSLLLVLIGSLLPRLPRRLRLLRQPFTYMAGVAAAATLLTGSGWTFIGGNSSGSAIDALAASWWLGGLTFTLLLPRLRLRTAAWAAALSFPVAAWLTQWSITSRLAAPIAWFALGWALLAPIYLVIGRWLQQQDAELERAYGQTTVFVGRLLIVLSALWALTDANVAALVHLWLAGTAVLAALLWQQPRHLWLGSLFLVGSSGAWQAARGATPAALTLPWALLAILHLIAAIRLERISPKTAARLPRIPPKLLLRLVPLFGNLAAYTVPLYGAAVALAGLAILPALAFFDQPLLTYALGNWVGLSGWLAYLAHRRSQPGLQKLMARPRLQTVGPAFFHWPAALPLVAWFWLFWINGRYPASGLALAVGLLAWALLGTALRLRRLRWAYGRPWQSAAHLANAVALFALYRYGAGADAATLTLLAVSLFYFAAAWLLPAPRAFYWGGLLFPIATISGMVWLEIDVSLLPLLLAAIATGYMLVAFWLERLLHVPGRMTNPMYRTGLWLSTAVIVTMLMVTVFYWEDWDLAWAGAAGGVMGLGFCLYAWQFHKSAWAHRGIWLLTCGAGLLVKLVSTGSGRSAPLIALLAAAYILPERRLHHLALTAPKPAAPIFRRAWRIYRRPLQVAGWSVSLIAIGAALLRNVFWIGGRTPEMWAIAALLIVNLLYAAAAGLYRQARFIWLAAGLVVVPWTLGTHWLWGSIGEWYALSWVLLLILMLGAGVRLAQLFGMGKWSHPPMVVAHLLLPYALLWGALHAAVSTATFLLAIGFYLAATWVDRRFGQPKTPDDATPSRIHPLRLSRFLYPALILLPIWAIYLMRQLLPQADSVDLGLMLLLFVWPLLLAGRQIWHWEPAYRRPFYLVAYGTAVMAMLLVLPERPALIGVLLFNTALAAASAHIFRRPGWLYPAAILLPAALALILAESEWDRIWHYGWMLELVAAGYLGCAWLLHRRKLRRYATPLLIMLFVVSLPGLLPSLADPLGALVGFGLAVLVFTMTAVWRRWMPLFGLAVAVAVVPYWAAVDLLNVAWRNFGLAAWPGILLALGAALLLDAAWGIEPAADGTKANGRFPWSEPDARGPALWVYLTRWWALPLYGVALAGVLFSAAMPVAAGWKRVLVLAPGTVLLFYMLIRFRLRGWLLLAWAWLQFTFAALLAWLNLARTPPQLALTFLPMTALTLFAALLVQEVRREAPVVARTDEGWQWHLRGWSLPLFLLLAANLGMGQILTIANGAASAPATLLHGVMLGVLASFWGLALPVYLALAAGVVALVQFLTWQSTSLLIWPPALAVVAAVYGLAGYGLRIWRPEVKLFWGWAKVWERPLRRSGQTLALLVLLLMIAGGYPVFFLLAGTLVQAPVLSPQEAEIVTMVVRTAAVLGVYYLAAALAERRPRLSYLALWLLLTSWSFWLLLLQGARNLQWYAIPAGVVLLLMGWLENTRGSKVVAPWLDRTGVLLLLGSAFWQSFGAAGGWYATLMIGEGLLLVWWGSLRRVRRLLYAGVVGVVTAVVSQLIEPILALNTLVLLLLGALLVALGIGLERRLDTVRSLSQEFRERLEAWE